MSPVGHPIGQFRALRAEHLFIDQAEIDHSPEQELGGTVKPGDLKYLDYNGNGIVNSDDEVWMGYPGSPQIEYGFGPSFKYKNWDFSILMQGVAERSIMMGGIWPFGSSNIRGVLKFVAKSHWSLRNQNIYAKFPRLSINTNANNTVASSHWLRNGSYMRLKYVDIGYTFPQSLFNTFERARVYISGRDLVEFSPFKLWDPELGGGNGLAYPLQRTINVGIQITF